MLYDVKINKSANNILKINFSKLGVSLNFHFINTPLL